MDARPRYIPLAMTIKNDGHVFFEYGAPLKMFDQFIAIITKELKIKKKNPGSSNAIAFLFLFLFLLPVNLGPKKC